jgi:membrane protease YdiL (CAAX protease family)
VEESYINKNGFSYPNNTTAKAVLWGLYPLAVYIMAAVFVTIIFMVVIIIDISLSGQLLDLNGYTERVFSCFGYILLGQQVLTLGAVMPIFLAHRKYLPKRDKKNTVGAVVLGVVFALSCSAIVGILQSAVYDVFQIIDGAGYETYGIIDAMPMWLQIISVVIFAPVVEEIMFRGILLNRLESRFPKWAAVVVSAALFGAMHLNWTQGIFAGLTGLALGFLYVRTRSLWLCIFAHAANNLYATLAPLIPWSNPYIPDVILAVVTLVPIFVVWLVKRKKATAKD